MTLMSVCMMLSTQVLASGGHGGHGGGGIPNNHAVVGRSMATGQLGLGDNSTLPHHGGSIAISSSLNPAFPGWFGNQIGMLQLIDGDHTTSSIGMLHHLEPGHNIHLKIVSHDPGLAMYDNLVNPLNAGDDFFLFASGATGYGHGSANQHTHPHIHILPGYDGTTPLPVMLQFIDIPDQGVTAYSASDPFHVTFVPEPATMSLLGLGAMTLLRRKRA